MSEGMLCNICQSREATVHLTEIINNKIMKLHLCEDCAKKKSSEMESHFGLSDLLAGLADFGMRIEEEESGLAKCGFCGMKYEDFKQIGRLGCAQCYTTFEKTLGPLLKRVHGSDRHSGKAPVAMKQSMTDERELQQLKEQLHRAITAEEFEEAARLRDEIRKKEKREKK